MHNPSGITNNSYSFSHWQNPSFALHLKYFCTKETLQRLKRVGLNILAVMTVGTLLLGGIYFFLVQLANHGW